MLDSLKEIGLSDSEIKVYKDLATNGKRSVLGISKLSGINRSYCYELLEKLVKKGFLRKILVNDKTYWEALPSKVIIDNIKSITNEIEISLNSLVRNENETATSIQMYEGKKGVLAICNQIAESKTKVIGFGAEGQLKKFCPNEYLHIFKKIRKNKIRFELITLKKKTPIIKDLTKYIEFDKEFESCVEVNIYEDNTVLFFWRLPLMAVQIKDASVANSFRNYHKQLWGSCA